MVADCVMSFPASSSRAMRMFTPRDALLRVLRAVVLPERTALRAGPFRVAPMRAGPFRAAPLRAAVFRAALRPAPPAALVSPLRRAAPLDLRAVFLACLVDA